MSVHFVIIALKIIISSRGRAEGVSMECEGNCEKHDGPVRCVRVYNNSKDWGIFNYCNEAINEDIRRGFNVDVMPLPEPPVED